MTVISTAGQVLTPLLVLPRKEARCRKQSNGTYETCSDFPHQPNYRFIRPVAGVDTDILFSWSNSFVEETDFFHRNNKKILLILDGY